jgi:hypothetical protein
MPRAKESRRPVSSFGPELLELLTQGATKEIRIPCPSMRVMKNLQMRLHLLRGAMQREKHPQYNLVTRARTSCTWDFASHPSTKRHQFPADAKECVLFIRPNDSQFTDIIKQAGISVSDASKDIMDDVPAAPAPKNPVVEPTPDQPFDPYERFKS